MSILDLLEYLALEPREVIDAHSVLLPRDGHEDVLTLQHLHLLEPSPGDQLINLALSRPATFQIRYESVRVVIGQLQS